MQNTLKHAWFDYFSIATIFVFFTMLLVSFALGV